jgi:hypothetical protein
VPPLLYMQADHTNQSPVISCRSWEARLRVGIPPRRHEEKLSARIKHDEDRAILELRKKRRALDRFFSNVFQVLPQLLGIVFSKYQRSIVRRPNEIDL